MFIDLLVAVEAGSGLHGLERWSPSRARRTRHCSWPSSGIFSEQIDAEGVSALRVAFNCTCHAAGVPGRLAVEVGSLAESVCERARWSDLVVLERSEGRGHNDIYLQPLPGPFSSCLDRQEESGRS